MEIEVTLYRDVDTALAPPFFGPPVVWAWTPSRCWKLSILYRNC